MPPSTDWLARLPDDLPFASIRAIPATHNSGTSQTDGPIRNIGWLWAKCQKHSLAEQLEMGVRCLDLRLCDTVDKAGTVYVSHTIATNLQFSRALGAVHDFLNAHPTEFVVLCFKRDWEHRKKWKSTDLVRKLIGEQRFRRCPATDGLQTPLGRLRGCVLVVSEEEDIFTDMPGQWPATTLVTAGVRCWDMQFAQAQKKLLEYVQTHQAESDLATGRYCFLGCDVVCVPMPPMFVASQMNEWLLQQLPAWDRTGFLCVDFAHPRLVAAAVALNFRSGPAAGPASPATTATVVGCRPTPAPSPDTSLSSPALSAGPSAGNSPTKSLLGRDASRSRTGSPCLVM